MHLVLNEGWKCQNFNNNCFLMKTVWHFISIKSALQNNLLLSVDYIILESIIKNQTKTSKFKVILLNIWKIQNIWMEKSGPWFSFWIHNNNNNTYIHTQEVCLNKQPPFCYKTKCRIILGGMFPHSVGKRLCHEVFSFPVWFLISSEV